ncbi:MAG: hypothetical protein JF613_01735 [Acidobacteria bacterium]|nr:hypothetical protein [Acidobacteriota bacterium]
MKRLIAMIGCAVLVAAAPALAQTKTVKGSVTNVGASSITVKVDGKDMTFNVDAKTTVVAKGASTKTREAQAARKAGPGITEVVKTGEPVEVVYHEQDMHAATVRAISAVPAPAAAKSATAQGEAAAKPKSMTATGVVSAVTGSSLTVKEKTGDATFSVDNKTVVSGTGLGTAGRKLMEAGGKPTLADFVKDGDTVTVTYHDSGETKTASTVRIVHKKM